MKREPYGMREWRVERINEIWALLAKGWTVEEIGEELDIQRRQVYADLLELFKEHGVNSQIKLALKWHGLPYRTI